MTKTIKIFGSPGTGKTTTLLKLLEEKIAEGYRPDKIGFFSFTRRAIKEARSRVIKKFNLSEDDLEYFRTIHSMCYRTLNINSGQVFKGERVREFSEIARVEIAILVLRLVLSLMQPLLFPTHLTSPTINRSMESGPTNGSFVCLQSNPNYAWAV